jgi:hypothetical protein
VRHYLIILSLACSSSTLFAQFTDSLQYILRNKYSIDARLESRNSFINHQLTSVTGVRLGLAYQRKLRIGGGLSWLKSEVTSPFLVDGPGDVQVKEDRYLKFVYVCYYVDFVFHKTKRWQLSVPIQAGTGMSWFQKESSYVFRNRDPKYFLLLYEPGITVQFKITRWLGLGNDVAYRFVLRNNRRTAGQLNSPTYSFKLLFWIDQLFFELLPEHKLSKKYGPAYW